MLCYPPFLFQGLKALSAAASLGQLHQLDLSHNQLGPAAAESLQQLVSAAGRLLSLKLRNTGVGGAGGSWTLTGPFDVASQPVQSLTCLVRSNMCSLTLLFGHIRVAAPNVAP